MVVCPCVAERKVSSADGERDSEVEDYGRKTQPDDERMEGSPETQEEGRSGLTHVISTSVTSVFHIGLIESSQN